MMAWESSTARGAQRGAAAGEGRAGHGSDGHVFPDPLARAGARRAFTAQEVQVGLPVLVLGYDLADKLFEGQDPIGREVKIFDIPYRIIGVVEKQGNLFGLSLDKFAVAPATAPLKRYVNPPRVVRCAGREAVTQADMREAMTEAEAVMRSRRHLRPREPNDFAMETADEVLDFWARSAACCSSRCRDWSPCRWWSAHRHHEHSC